MGELSPIDTWMELWVVRERDYDRACAILDTVLSGASAPAWTCTGCNEENDASFEVCWHCGNPGPELPDTGRTVTIEY